MGFSRQEYWSGLPSPSPCGQLGYRNKGRTRTSCNFLSFGSIREGLSLVSVPFSEKVLHRDFPGGPVVKTSPSKAGGICLIPGLGAKIPHASWPKNQNIKQKQHCNKFMKTLKNSPHKKKKKKNLEKKKSAPGLGRGPLEWPGWRESKTCLVDHSLCWVLFFGAFCPKWGSPKGNQPPLPLCSQMLHC